MDTAAAPSYKGYRYPAEVIAHAVWPYHRFPLSFREVEELLRQRGITVSYGTIRQWCATFGPLYAAGLRRRQLRPGDKWHLAAITTAGLDPYVIRREHSTAIAHNKFIVASHEGAPVAVWTGSTNITEGGIFGHSNLGHAIADPTIAAAYADYWTQLSTDPRGCPGSRGS